MKIKTSELTGAALDWAVAKCEGVDTASFLVMHQCDHFHFSTDWAHGGPIIEREDIGFWVYPCNKKESPVQWVARNKDSNFGQLGASPLIAAMRCFVCSRLGETVDVPEELK